MAASTYVGAQREHHCKELRNCVLPNYLKIFAKFRAVNAFYQKFFVELQKEMFLTFFPNKLSCKNVSA